MRLALFQPDIPQNLGAAIRLAACLGVGLDVIEPCGFPLSDAAIRRSAMDYSGLADVRRHAGWADFRAATAGDGRLVLFTTQARQPLHDFAFEPGDILLFGNEGAGAPDEVHARADLRVRIPIRGQVRSLNLGVSAGIALAEALRQTSGWPR